MKIVPLILIALFALVSGIILQRSLNTANPGSAELEIAFPDLEGKPHKLTEWKGKVLIVNFWAVVPPCLQEMPEFVKLQHELGLRACNLSAF